MVGMARNSDMAALITLETPRLERFMAASSPSTNAMTAPSTVVSVAKANEVNNPSTKSAMVKWPPNPGCVSMVKKSPTASAAATAKGVSP